MLARAHKKRAQVCDGLPRVRMGLQWACVGPARACNGFAKGMHGLTTARAALQCVCVRLARA
eukprot:8741386-Alexandrium_andersonii.AAC.1